jgi:restriction system protein
VFTKDDIPKYHEFMLPVLRSMSDLGGSASTREIREAVMERLGAADELVALAYDEGERSVYIDRLDWGRSYCKMGGLVESPKRGLFLLTAEGRTIAAMADPDAERAIDEVHRRVRTERAAQSKGRRQPSAAEEAEPATGLAADDDPDLVGDEWQSELLGRLHQMSPQNFENFCVYLLKSYGLELTRVGGSGDEGIDAIGTAPLSPVLSARVAVQAKRYDPAGTVGRDAVALFQRDAQAKGAERAIFVTLARFTASARRAAVQATPTVDLIDGDRLCELALEQGVGLSMQPVLDAAWFDRFDQDDR